MKKLFLMVFSIILLVLSVNAETYDFNSDLLQTEEIIREYNAEALEKLVPDKTPEERLVEINQLIEEKNARWTAGLNEKSLMSVENKRKLLGTYVIPFENSQAIYFQVSQDLPSSFSWKSKDGIDWMTPVKSQGNCGACWAFAVLGVVEPVFNIKNNDPNLDLDLSEQQLISKEGTGQCCANCGNCNGGGFINPLAYLKSTGVADEACFLYTMSDSPCNLCSDWQSRKYQINSSIRIANTTQNLKQALVDYGPLVATIVSSDMFYYYESGVYEELGDVASAQVYHAVVIVGWDDAENAWIVKNSWGTSWGDNGYGKIVYGNVEKYNDIRTVTVTLIDKDQDGVYDGFDNCKYIYNPNQEDLDSDGKGDLCDDYTGDFIVTNFRLSYPDAPKVNEPLVLKFYVFNNANSSTNLTYTINSNLTQQLTYTTFLNAYQYKPIMVTLNYAQAGTFYPKLIIDPNNLIIETNENNNNFVTNLTVTQKAKLLPNPTKPEQINFAQENE